MKTYCPQSWHNLVQLGASKGNYLGHIGDTFDYALPQQWLNEFAAFCEDHDLLRGFDADPYYMILVTTVWGYGDLYRGPITFCQEVAKAHEKWVASGTF